MKRKITNKDIKRIYGKLFPKIFFKGIYLRNDLDEEDFELWRKWWFRNIVGCNQFVCRHDSDSCGIARICGFCSRYRAYKNYHGKINTNWCDPIRWFWFSLNDTKPHPIHKDKEWKNYHCKGCLECSGGLGKETYIRRIEKKDINPLKKIKYKYIKKPIKVGDYISYCKSWCKKYNDYMLKKGFIIDRSFEKWSNDKGAKELLGILPGDAEAKYLKFKLESPKIKDIIKGLRNR